MICPKCGGTMKMIVFISVHEARFLGSKIGLKR
jgi:hypothetical protein